MKSTLLISSALVLATLTVSANPKCIKTVEKKQELAVFKDRSTVDLGASVQNAKLSFMRVDVSHIDQESKLVLVDGKKTKTLLKGEKRDYFMNKGAEFFTRLTGDVFGLGLLNQYNSSLQDLKIYKFDAEARKMVSIGDLNIKTRDMRPYTRKAVSLNDITFAVLDNHSYVVGPTLELGLYFMDMDLTFVTVQKNNKMKTQTINIQSEQKTYPERAIGLSVASINANEVALYGRGTIKIVRRAGGQFKMAETLKFEPIDGQTLDTTVMEVVTTGKDQFVVRDEHILGLTDHAGHRSQSYTFQKKNGVYKLVAQELMDGPRGPAN